MSDELKPLSLLFQNRMFRIPDYQRGYAWQQQQLADCWDDLINLQNDHYHYTGLLSFKTLERNECSSVGEDIWLVENGYKVCQIVDGQQRITTFVILLNEIINFVRNLEVNQELTDKEIYIGFESIEDIRTKYICKKRPPNFVVTTYLFDYEVDNPSAEYMHYRIFEEPNAGTVAETYYTKNLKFAKDFFAKNISNLYDSSNGDGIDAIFHLYKRLTQQLMFNVHEINNDYDVFVAFETMNNRGKKLTNLELLKNRLIYLTTLYKDNVFDDQDKTALRRKINDAWKEVYYQLGRNKDVPLSDDEFLRAHWIIYFKDSRSRGDDYIKFLLTHFSAKRIFEKVPVLLEESESQIQETDTDSDETDEQTEEQETIEVSKLQPTDIEGYVNSLKEMAKFWYDTYFPYENNNLSGNEKKIVDRLNRIGITYFRPLVTVIISRSDIADERREYLLSQIERYIFSYFRLAGYNSTFGSSDYYRITRQLYLKAVDIDDISSDMMKQINHDMPLVVSSFSNRIDRYFANGSGYYGWTTLRYFFYEYESSLSEKNKIDRFISWKMFATSEKDKVSIEHILPQTPSKYYWRNQFRQFTPDEIKQLSGALGNLLPLSQSINSALQNDSFDDKKHSKNNGRRGYENGSHSEIEVSKNTDWDADRIYDRSKKLLEFMSDRWNLKLTDDQIAKLIDVPFVKDNREIPPELTKENFTQLNNKISEDIPKKQLDFWTGFCKYATENGRSDITKQQPGMRSYYDVHIGARGYHLYFSIPYGKRIVMGIYTNDHDSYERLLRGKEAIESSFGNTLNWSATNDNADRRSITFTVELNVFESENVQMAYDWIIDAFDRVTKALKDAGE